MAKGVINTTALDTLTWSASDARYPAVCKVATGVYAIAYMVVGNYGHVTTVSVAEDGTLATVDTLQFESTGVKDSYGQVLNIVKKPGTDICVIVWCSTASFDGFMCTVDIDAAGNIGAVQDTWEYQAVGAQGPDLCHIAGHIFAVLFRDNNSDGYIQTFAVANDGTITKSVISSWEYDNVEGQNATMIKVSGTTYLVGYSHGSSASHIFTCKIADNGTITKSKIDTLDFPSQSTTSTGHLNIVDCGDGYFLIMHQAGSAADSRAEALTCTVTADGTISDSWIDTEGVSVESGRYTAATVAEGLLVATYDQAVIPADVGCHMKTYPISNGVIGSMIQDFEFETDANDSHTRLVRAYPEVYVVLYYGSGLAKSYSISEGIPVNRAGYLTEFFSRR